MPEELRTIVYVCPVDHRGTSVFVKGWLGNTGEKPKTPIVFAQDLGSSAQDLTNTAQQFGRRGFNAYTYEMRLKRSDHSQSRLAFEELASDLLQVVAWIKHRESGKRPIVVGQGLGALVAVYFAQGHSKFAAGLVFSAPLFFLAKKLSPFRRFLLRTLTRTAPSINTPSIVASLQDIDAQSVGKISISLTQEILIAISRAPKLFMRISLPTLLICPSRDKLCRYEPIKRLMSKHKNESLISLLTIDVDEHNLLTGRHSDDVCATIINWLENRP